MVVSMAWRQEAIGDVIGQVLQGSYRVERKVGEGGMGVVFEASHLRLERRFAVKMLHPSVAENTEALARFWREAKITSALGHPNILEVIDVNDTESGAPYIIMELLDGEDLAERIKRQGRLNLDATAAIFAQIVSALRAAHQRGVVHRDLKPQNIFLCRREERDDYVKILDFGLSKVIGSSSMMTGMNALMGTPSYMAPEQAMSSTEIDRRADIYAAGAIVYEMLSGRPPICGDTVLALLNAVINDEPAPLKELRPDLPQPVVQVIHKALSKARDDRPSSIEDFWRAFEEARGVRVEARPRNALEVMPTEQAVLERDAEMAPTLGSGAGEDAIPWTQNEAPAGASIQTFTELASPGRSKAAVAVVAIVIAVFLGVGALYRSGERHDEPVTIGRGANASSAGGRADAEAPGAAAPAVRPTAADASTARVSALDKGAPEARSLERARLRKTRRSTTKRRDTKHKSRARKPLTKKAKKKDRGTSDVRAPRSLGDSLMEL